MPKARKGAAATAAGGKATLQTHQTPEQLKHTEEQRKETKRQRDLVTEKLWPLLVKGTTSISNTNQFMGTLQMTIRQVLNNQMTLMKLSELKITEGIDGKVPQADYYAEFLDILKDEPVSVAVGLIEGINQELERLFRKEMAERPLSSLKTDFIKDNAE